MVFAPDILVEKGKNFTNFMIGWNFQAKLRRNVGVVGLYTELIFSKFWLLRGAEHRGIAHQHRWRHLQVPMLGRVQIEHELAERPLQPGELAAQHDEARAGQLRGRLEIHGGADLDRPSLAQLEMLLR